MKKLLLFLLLTPLCAAAQIVTIPDANFKLQLIQNGVDTNSDGYIQLSEAQAATNLTIQNTALNPIASVEGLQSFTNLTALYLSANATTIDVSSMTSLQGLAIINCPNLTTLNTTGLTAVKSLMIDSCPLIFPFSIQGMTLLENFYATGNSAWTDVDLTPCAAMKIVHAYNFKSINASGLTQLTNLDCSGGIMSTLNVSGCTALIEIFGSGATIENLDLTGNTSLQTLHFGPIIGITPAPPLMNMNATGCTSLTSIHALTANMGSMNLTGCSSLTQVFADMNHLNSVNFSGCTSLQTLYLGSSNLTTIDVTDCTSLTTMDVSGNPLETIYIKNGINEHIGFSNWPVEPAFICGDDVDVAYIISTATLHEETVLNSYCTFTPGGNYNTITGTVWLDTDGDGCSQSAIIKPLVKVGYDNGSDQYGTFSNLTGQYTLFAHAGTMTPTAQLENPAYWNVVTAAPVTFADEDSHNEVRDFCITPNGVHPDVEVAIIPMQPARPGFDANYYIILKNKGNQTISNQLTFTYNDGVLDLLSAEPAADSQSAGSLTWNYSDLAPFGIQSFYVNFNVNSPMETPPVNIDDVLDFTAVASLSGDETPLDNTFTLHQTVVGAFDPNDKHCLQGTVVPPTQIGNYLFYVINFENTGNFPAENVAIKDLIDVTKYDIASFQMLGHSHNVTPAITGGKVEFFFEDINLDPNEYGYVGFKIKTKSDLPVGSTVTNTASIYFDFNAPVVTNPASTIFQSLDVGENTFDATVKVFPNSSHDMVQITSDALITKISLMDIQGRIIGQFDSSANATTLDVSGYASGLYAMKIITEKGTVSHKLIVE